MSDTIEYIQFHPLLVTPNLWPDYIDPDECQSDDLLCISKGDEHYHINVTPFSLGGFGVTHYDASISELVPLLRANFADAITSMINGDTCFTLAFKLIGIADYETGHIDMWDYELLGQLVQDGNNLIVKPLEVSA